MSFKRFYGISLFVMLCLCVALFSQGNVFASSPDRADPKVKERYEKLNESARTVLLEQLNKQVVSFRNGRQQQVGQGDFQRDLYQYWLVSRGTAFGHRIAELLFSHYAIYQGRTANIWDVYDWELKNSKGKSKELESWRGILLPLTNDMSVNYQKTDKGDYELVLDYVQVKPFKKGSYATFDLFSVPKDAMIEYQLNLNWSRGDLIHKGSKVFTKNFGRHRSYGYRDGQERINLNWDMKLKPGTYLARIKVMGVTYYRTLEADNLEFTAIPLGAQYMIHTYSRMYPKTKHVKLHLVDTISAKGKKDKNWRSYVAKSYEVKTYEPFILKLPEKRRYEYYTLVVDGVYGTQVLSVQDEKYRKSRYQLTTDRTLYRPGHEIKFKVLRRDYASGQIKLPAQKKVRVVLKEEGSRARVMRSMELNWSADGAVSGSFKVGETWNPGTYVIALMEDPDRAETQEGNQRVRYDFSHEVEVLAYRKSDLKAEMEVLSFENGVMRIRINAGYLSGGAVNNAEASISLKGKYSWYRSRGDQSTTLAYQALPVRLRMPTRPQRAWFANLRSDEEAADGSGDYFSIFDDYNYQDDIASDYYDLESGVRVVKLHIERDRHSESLEEFLADFDELKLKLVVTDQIGQVAETELTLPTTARSRQPVIEVSTDQVTYGHQDKIVITVSCKDAHGKPLRNREVKLQIDQLKDIRVEMGHSGIFSDRSDQVTQRDMEFRPLKEMTVKTDRQGVAKVTWPVSGMTQGILRVQAKHWYRKDAMVDDVMQALIYHAEQTSTNQDVYFTWTAEGLTKERVAPVDRQEQGYWGSMILDQVIAKPGEELSVLVVQSRPAKRAWVMVAGMSGTRVFKTPRAANYWMKVPIDPKESAGVIKVIFLAESPHGNMLNFHQQIVYVDQPKNDIEVKVKTDKKSYRPGDVMKLEIQTSNQDKGIPAVVEIGVVDEAIFRMQEVELSDMRRFFRPLPFYDAPRYWSTGGLTQMDDNVIEYPELDNKKAKRKRNRGGGGLFGDAGGEEESGADVRQRAVFKDTIYYRATAKTDEQGRLMIEVPTPDDLTQWRITVRSHAKDQYFGHSISKAITKQPVSVRMVASRFYVEGDQAVLRASVANMTKQEGSFKITLKLEGAEQKHREQYRVVTIGAGETLPLEWPIRILEQGEMKATVRATSKIGSDEIMVTRPVRYNAVARSVGGAEIMKKQWTRQLKMPERQPLEVGNLVLVTSQASRRELLTALPYLVSYPYGCVEQTMSRFLPALVVKQQMNDLKLNGTDYGKKLPEVYQKGIDKLYGYQHKDGGWGWWADDASDPWMSAYVMWGILEAKAVGYEVPEEMFHGGLTYLARRSGWQVKRTNSAKWIPGHHPNAKALPPLALYALVKATGYRPDIQLERAEHLEKKVTVQFMDGAVKQKEIKVGYLQITGIKRVTVQVNHLADLSWLVLAGYKDLAKFLPEKPIKTHGRGTTNRRNALILMAHYYANPESDSVQFYVHDLLSKRRGASWRSTLDTAYAVMALGRVLPDREPAPLTLTMNGKTQVIKPGLHEIPFSEFKKQQLKLSLSVDDDRPVYVSWHLPYLTRVLPKADLADQSYQDDYDEEKLKAITIRWRHADGNEDRIEPESGVSLGDLVEMQVRLHTDRDFGLGLMEIPIPAGFEPLLEDQKDGADYWGNRPVVKDDRILLPLRSTGRRYYINIRFRATQPGTFHTPPPHVFDMYNPGIRLYGESMKMIIRR